MLLEVPGYRISCCRFKNSIDKTYILNRDREVMIQINSYKFISKLFYPTKAKCTIVGLIEPGYVFATALFLHKKEPFVIPGFNMIDFHFLLTFDIGNKFCFNLIILKVPEKLFLI